MKTFVEQIVERCQEHVDARLQELGGAESLGVENSPHLFHGLTSFIIRQSDAPGDIESNIKEAIKFSMWKLYNEAVIAYLMNLERVTIIACRGVTERALRIVFQNSTGLVANDKWTLGLLINHCEEKAVSMTILDIARKIKTKGDNLSHAKHELEHHWSGIVMEINPKNPDGPPVANYTTDDAKACLLLTRDLIALVFGVEGN